MPDRRWEAHWPCSRRPTGRPCWPQLAHDKGHRRAPGPLTCAKECHMPVDLDAVPNIIAASQALAEAHRLDLALFVAFEEESLRVAEGLLRHVPGANALRLVAEQKGDDERHLVLFRRRLQLSLGARPNRAAATEALLLRVLQGETASTDGPRLDELVRAVVIPPLGHFFERCRMAADGGNFL